jgi:hypothetical protein
MSPERTSRGKFDRKDAVELLFSLMMFVRVCGCLPDFSGGRSFDENVQKLECTDHE